MAIPERKRKLADDPGICGSLQGGPAFDALVLAVHRNCRNITPAAVRSESKEMPMSKEQDLKFPLERNKGGIMAENRKEKEI